MKYVFFIFLFFLYACTPNNKDWSSYGNDLFNQRFSDLDQINTKNIDQLDLAWQIQTGTKSSFQATPIVKDGVMYVSLPFNDVIALDGKTGQEIWRYKHDRNKDWPMCCGPANRGLGIYKNQLFMGTVDARLISLDIKTGNKIWDVNVVNNSVKTETIENLGATNPLKEDFVSGGTGVGMNMAPVIYNNKVIIGITGVGYGLHVDQDKDAPLGSVVGVKGQFGRPGFLAAFDVNTGKKVWQFDTIASENWEGLMNNFTDDGVQLNRDIEREKALIAKFPNAPQFGGGSAWTTPAIDPETNTLIFGVGNPSPQMNGESRPGDNLYTVSIVALDANTGEKKWHYQQVPHDLWGYDVASPPVIFEKNVNNKPVKVVGQAGKTGWFYMNNLNTGQLITKSEAFVPQKNMFQNPNEDGIEIYPGILGGSNWSPISIAKTDNLAIVSALHAPIKYQLHKKNKQNPTEFTSSEPIDGEQYGLLSAIDLSNGNIAWSYKTEQPLIGGSLSTKGGLTFFGEGNGDFNAVDSSSGKLLWSYHLEAGVNAPAISYQIEGKQYIAVAVGGNKIFGFKQGDYISVFTLD
jgi:glucose dehydrogenase